MEGKKKRKYIKPKVVKIYLDAKCAVLGACKTSGQHGPSGLGCIGGIPGCAMLGS